MAILAPYVETAVQWLYDSMRCQILIQRKGEDRTAAPAPPGEWVGFCWEVGHSLSMMQAHGIPAQPVIEEVSRRLVDEFGSEGDYTPYGIRTMRQFYLDYFERPQLQPLLRSVHWDCHKLVLSLCRDPAQQEYYLRAARDENLSAEQLASALKDRRYELSAAAGPAAKPPVGKTGAAKAPKLAKVWGKRSRKATGKGTTSISR